jgi:hypothetical protein
MSLGYQRPITDNDMSKLMPSDNADDAISSFEKAWISEENNAKKNT